MKIKISFLLLYFISVVKLSLTGISLRVVGGKEAKPHEFPYLVTLTNANTTDNNCGGAIIDGRWILTAGHCLYGYEIIDYDIIAGKHDLSIKEFGQQLRHASKFIIHPKFSPYIVGPNDIGLIRLNEPFKFSKTVNQIDLPDEKNSIPLGKGILSGWGSISYFLSAEYPTTLQTSIIHILENDLCKEMLEGVNYDETNLCSGPLVERVGHCTGDSGAPLVQMKNRKPFVVGVASFAYVTCGDEEHPSVFVRVSHYIDWIKNSIKNN